MLIDNNGDAVFIYTPTSLRSAGISKAHDTRHAAKMFKAAGEDGTGRWARFHFTSLDNPYNSPEGLAEVARDMSQSAYRQEILAEDDELSSSHLVYGVWNETLCKIPHYEIPSTWPVYSGHDFGSANPAAIFFARVKLPLPTGAPPYMRLNDLVAFHEYLPGRGQSTALNVDAFKLVKEKTVASAGGNHNEDGSRGDYAQAGWPIQEPPIGAEGGPSLKRQIDRVTAIMELNKWYVFEDLVYYLSEIASCQWKYDKEGTRTNEIDGEARFHLCFVAGTMVRTINGEKLIELIRPGDLVATRQGYHAVKDCGITQVADTVEVSFSDGSRLRGTKDHPVWVKGSGFVPLFSVRYGDIIEVWKEKQLPSAELPITGIPQPNVSQTVCTSRDKESIFIGQSGKLRMGQSLKDSISIIKMAIVATMIFPIWDLSFASPMNLTTIKGNHIGSQPNNNLIPCERNLYSGTRPLKGMSNMFEQLSRRVKHWLFNIYNAFFAARDLIIRESTRPVSALTNASQPIAVHQAQIMNQESVLCAGKNLPSTNTKVSEPVPVYVVRLVESNKTPVYNLTVDTVHEYYANGVLVSNCACVRYGLSLSDFIPETIRIGGSNVIRVIQPKGW
jgi:hypothetical protein